MSLEMQKALLPHFTTHVSLWGLELYSYQGCSDQGNKRVSNKAEPFATPRISFFLLPIQRNLVGLRVGPVANIAVSLERSSDLSNSGEFKRQTASEIAF